MLNVIEAFSGIGSQAKALDRIKIKHKIVSTIEWDLNAIYAYDIIHNGEQNLREFDGLTKKDLIIDLQKYTLSGDGKKPITEQALKAMTLEGLKRILFAIKRTKNLVSITDVKAKDLPNNVDLFTYSFPCQDLSICSSWHGNTSGLDRDAHNRSGMLWEVERILKEYVDIGKELPNFLLMENVSNILSKTHNCNFNQWKDYLQTIGYYNKVYTLDAANFGIPQRRKRTYMLSVLCNNDEQIDEINNYFENNNLEIIQNTNPEELKPLIDFLRLEYSNEIYKREADNSNPNNTPSRIKILNDGVEIFNGEKITSKLVKTITTKQDRNPNSGLIRYKSSNETKAPYRNLTPRECFLLMGFDEDDFEKLMDNDFNIKKNHNFFTREKLIRMSGNSIVVNVLEKIFSQVEYINRNIFENTDD